MNTTLTDVEIEKILNKSGINIIKRNRTGNDTGIRLELSNGAIVNLYDKGKVNVQGKNKDQVEMLLGFNDNKGNSIKNSYNNENNIFVVYGQDNALKHQLEAMLRRWGLNPLILNQLPSDGATIIEKLEKYASGNVKFGIALATPDDEGKKTGNDQKLRPRVRQNVVLELGILLAKLGRKKVAILLQKAEDMENPSDINGLIYFPFSISLDEIKVDLAKEMSNQGISIDLKNL